MSELLEYLRGRKPGPFKVKPSYSPAGDMLIVYFEDVPCYAENLTPDVVVERANDDKRIVGVKLFGVPELVTKARTDQSEYLRIFPSRSGEKS